jgi:[CysO sulfur-carrier protein]-S-L-cysteine hydrolase
VVISHVDLDRLIEQARAEAPNEACGLLATEGDRVVRVYPLRNAEASPVHYKMDPQQQLEVMKEIDDNDWDLAAIYHSHTHTRAYPSQTDVSLAFYPDTLYIITSIAGREPEVRAFRIVEGQISEEELEIDG